MTPLKPADNLPVGLEHYKSTPVFDRRTTPLALQSDHSTKLGVWGKIQVSAGQLRYTVTDPRRAAFSVELTAGGPPGIVEPTIVHRVELISDVTFQVEFWK
jgi:tellurite resistance-related uncharacterized protein